MKTRTKEPNANGKENLIKGPSRFRVLKTNLAKGPRDRSHLVLVDVMVNGITGSYRSKRWKSPKVAINEAKKDILRSSETIDDGKDIGFKDKKTGKVLTEKEIIDGYNKSGNKDVILQDYIKRNIKIYNKNSEKINQKKKKKSPTTRTIKDTNDNIINKELGELIEPQKDENVYEIDEEQAKEILKQKVEKRDRENAERYKGVVPEHYLKLYKDPEKLQKVATDLESSLSLEKLYETVLMGYFSYGKIGGKTELEISGYKKIIEDHRIRMARINDPESNGKYGELGSKEDREWVKEKGLLKSLRVNEVDLKNKRKKLTSPSWLTEEIIPPNADGLPEYKYKNEKKRKDAEAFYKSREEFIENCNETISNMFLETDKQLAILTRNAFLMAWDGDNLYGGITEAAEDVNIPYMFSYALKPKAIQSQFKAANRYRQTGLINDDRFSLRSKLARKKRFSGERIEPTYDYEPIKTATELKDALKTLKETQSDIGFARTALDKLGLNVPLYTGAAPGSVGTCKCAGGKAAQIAVTTEGRPSHMIRKTTVHEAMHGLLANTRKRGENFSAETMKELYSYEEPVVELIACHTADVLGEGIKQGMAMPSYMSQIIKFVFNNINNPIFQGAKGLSGRGEVLMNRLVNRENLRDLSELKSKRNKVTNRNVREVALDYLKNKGLTGEVISDKYGDKLKEVAENSLGELTTEESVNMSVLMSQLKSGGLTMEQAMQNPKTRGIAFILLCIILEEEDVEIGDLSDDILAEIL